VERYEFIFEVGTPTRLKSVFIGDVTAPKLVDNADASETEVVGFQVFE